MSENMVVTAVPRFRSFYGRHIDQIPLLLSGKDSSGRVVDVARVLITPKQVLHERVHGTNTIDRDLLRNNYVDTGYVTVADPNSDEVLIGNYAAPVVRELVHSINPQSELRDGALVINSGKYHEVKESGAHVLPPSVVNNLCNNGYAEQKAREAFWEYATEGDRQLVNDTLRLVQDTHGGGMNNRMGLFLPQHAKGLRLLCVDSVGDYISYALRSNDGLGSYYGRPVGVAVQAQARENLGGVLDAIQKGKGFVYGGRTYRCE